MVELEQIIKVALVTIKAKPDDYESELSDELALLGLKPPTDFIYAAAALIRENETLAGARAASEDMTSDDVSRLAVKEKSRIEQAKEAAELEKERLRNKKNREKAEKLERETHNAQFIDQLVVRLKELQDDLGKSNGLVEFGDYTVISRTGKDILRLRPHVKKAIGHGWVPLGGIHIAGPNDRGIMLFSQAMGFPKGKTPEQVDY
jgi:hypothetical protein